MSNYFTRYAGVGTRIIVKGIKFSAKYAPKYGGKAKAFVSAEGLYELATATAVGSMCTLIDRTTGGQGLQVIGGVALSRYVNLTTGEVNQELVDTLLWGGAIEGVFKLLGRDYTAEEFKDPNMARVLVGAAILEIAAGGPTNPLYDYVSGTASALLIEEELIFGTDAIRKLLEIAGVELADLIIENQGNFLTFSINGLVTDFIPNGLENILGDPISWWIEWGKKLICNCTINSPIVLDLDGDGVETFGLSDSGVMFDHDGYGRRTLTGWLNADDGFLVYDRDGDGLIKDGREMFGNATYRYDGEAQYVGGFENSGHLARCENGFEALAQEDSNGDGVLNHLDRNWSAFRIWRDLNQDGISQADELFTLDELGITELSLNYEDKLTPQGDGNVRDGEGFYIDANGQQHQLTDIWFHQDNSVSDFIDPIEVSNPVGGQQPNGAMINVNGSGALRSLQEASVQSGSLKNLFESFSQGQTRAEQFGLVEDLIYAWANTSGMAKSLQERCEGLYDVRHANIIEPVESWNRKLHVLEAFQGGYFFMDIPGLSSDKLIAVMLSSNNNSNNGNNSGVQVEYCNGRHEHVRMRACLLDQAGGGLKELVITWYSNQIQAINEAYDELVNSIYQSLALQTRLRPLLDLVDLSFNLETFEVAFDSSRLVQYFEGKMADDPINALSDLVDFSRCSLDFCGQMLGYELIGQAVTAWPLTSELRQLYNDLRINTFGSSYYTPNGGGENDFIIGGQGNDTIRGNDGDDIIYGGGGDDLLYGGDGNDRLYGGDGDDKLYGGNGDDILDGGAGNDLLDGGPWGNNIFVFGKGYGHDIVYGHRNTAEQSSKIRLLGLSREEVEFGQAARQEGYYTFYDFVVRIKETGETITVWRGCSNYDFMIAGVEFGDGSFWSWQQIIQDGLHGTDGDDNLLAFEASVIYGGDGNDTIRGSDYNDVLYGGDGDDKLYGGRGDDILDGGAGNDYLEGGVWGHNTYVFSKGYGHDKVYANVADDAQSNRIRLTGLSPEEVEFGMVARLEGSYTTYYDFVVRLKETGETMTVLRGMEYRFRITDVEFGDGTVWTWDEILRSGLHGTDGDDVLRLSQPTVVHGGAGNDTIWGSDYNDVLYGGDGDDKLYGGRGNDILDGGAGNDYLEGGVWGHNTYVFGKGYGHDKVYANVADDAQSNRIRLRGLSPEEVEFGMVARLEGSYSTYYDFVVRLKETGETMTVLRGMEYRFRITDVEFGDGTVWTWDEILQSGLHATDGDDALRLSQPTVVHGGAGNDTIWGSDYNDELYGGDGDDKLYGNRGDDILDGGAGNDYLEGGPWGHKTYVFGKGYGHDKVYAYTANDEQSSRIRLTGLSPEEVEFGMVASGSFFDFVVRIKETGESMTVLRGMESRLRITDVEFGDGTVWTWDEILQSGLHGTDGDDVLRPSQPMELHGGAGNDTLWGSPYDDELYGDDGDDKLYGGNGNDLLDGGAGNDYLEGGAGDDTYIFRAGGGRDTINNHDTIIGDDTLKLMDLNPEDLWFEKSGYHLVISLVGTDDKVTVNNWYSSDYYKIGTIETGDSALVYNQVAQMVQALAALGAPGAADGGWTEEQREALNPILTTYWQPRV